MEKKLKKPPEFIFFERYDSKTSFGFDDFEEKVKKQDVSIEILYFRTSKTNFPAASPDELLKKNKFTEISENLDESTETLLSLQSLNPGIQNRVFS
ncbi:MAG: hypothetical protein OEZ34_14090, partial [Spirochaetia bacterium]|nr:hypothetical protein [Spirochaetia bacterium]